MSATKKKRSFKYNRNLVLLFVALGVGALGSHLLNPSFAADYSTNHNPYGYADYCQLENNVTTVYGWAYDQDAAASPGPQPYVKATVGSQTLTVPSNIAGYRDTPINNWIKTNRPGQPTSSIYGWKAQFPSLYKGANYTISGTVLNYGAGANAALWINTGVTGIGSGLYFANNIVPQACLADKPAPPAPIPSPTPAPTPTPAPVKTTPKTTPKTSTPAPAAPAFTSPADATVTTGTLHTWLKIPVDSATSVLLNYGTDPVSLTSITPVQQTNGSDVTIQIDNLLPKTTYSYNIARTSAKNETATSSTATFTTRGYDSTLHFSDNGKALSGITATISGSQAKHVSNKQGDMVFHELDAKKYTVTFTYKNQKYTHNIDLTNIQDSSSSTSPVLALNDYINTAKLVAPAKQSTADTSSHATNIIIFIIVGLLLLAALIWFIIRRRRNPYAFDALPATPVPQPPAPAPVVSVVEQPAPAKEEKPKRRKTKTVIVEPSALEPKPEHYGESLREMVIKSMHDEASRRRKPPDD